MGKKADSKYVKMQSTESDYSFVARRNPKTRPEKYGSKRPWRKFDPIVRKVVEFIEKKMPSHSK